MTTLLAFFDNPFWAHLVLALLHSLWIGAVVALGLFVFLRRVPASRSGLRYAAALVALTLIVVGGLISLAALEAQRAESGVRKSEISILRASNPAIRNPQTNVRAEARTPNNPQSSRGTGVSPVIPRITGETPVPQIQSAITPYLAGLWLLGAALMLVRMIRRVMGAGSIKKNCAPLADPAIETLIAELRAAMGIARRIAVWVGDSPVFPCVVGAVWPAVLLPVSMLSGVPPEHLRAILAHELAHIRRHDYLVNLIQMLLESLLFFNPFVWWISGQVRGEREACCDAAAAAATGRRSDYARALVDFAQRRSGTGVSPVMNLRDMGASPAMSFTGEPPVPHPSGLLDRIRRLAQPGYRPALRMPWYSLTLFLIISALSLACIKKASDGAVSLAAKITSPEERIEKMTEIQKKYDSEKTASVKTTISGRVVTEDGAPLVKKNPVLRIHAERPHSSSTSDTQIKPDGSFTCTLEYNTFWLCASADGYAWTFASPLTAEAGGEIKGVTLILKRGFRGQVRVADPQGRPIPGVTINGYYNSNSRSSSYLWNDSRAPKTDAQGILTFDHASTPTLLLRGSKAGFEDTQWDKIKLAADKPVALTMAPAQPARGVVVAADGKPIAGAKIRLLNEVGGQMHPPGDAPVQATTDAEGRFTLDHLRAKTRYFYYADVTSYTSPRAWEAKAGDANLKFELVPAFTVEGRVLGVKLAQQQNGKPAIYYSQTYTYDHSSYGGGGQWVELQVRGDTGTFKFEVHYAGETAIRVGDLGKNFTVKESVKDLVFDLNQKKADAASTTATREVIFRFELPADSPTPTGHLRVLYTTPENPNSYSEAKLPLDEGETRMPIRVPARVGYQMGDITGYWFPEKMDITLAPGDTPLEVTIPAIPAGAIYGQVFEADGKPASGLFISVIEEKPSPLREKNQSLNVRGKDSSSPEDGISKFNLAPLPLGGKYVVVARRGAIYAISDPIALTEKNPLQEIKINLPKGILMPVRVTDEAGKPIEGAEVSLDFSFQSNGFGDGGHKTDADGMFNFADVNPNLRGKYSLTVIMPGYQDLRQEIKPGTKTIELRLKKGLELSGHAIDDETGKPLEGVEVYAMPEVPGGGYPDGVSYCEAEEKTNSKGEFHFSRLTDTPYTLNCRQGQILGSPVAATPGQPALIRVQLSQWEKKRRESGEE